MKYIILTLIFFPVFLNAQKHGVKNQGDKTELDFSETYLVERDTTESGVITIKLIPTKQVASELESTLGSLRGEEESLNV